MQAAPGERILIRFANLGFIDHTIVFPASRSTCSVVTPGTCRRAHNARRPTRSRSVPARAATCSSPLPPEGTYAFYDRGLSHYTGSADGTDAWVGGQRSEVRVIAGLGPQLKPNGWATKPPGPASSRELAQHAAPVISATGHRYGPAGVSSSTEPSPSTTAQPGHLPLQPVVGAQQQRAGDRQQPVAELHDVRRRASRHLPHPRCEPEPCGDLEYWVLAQDWQASTARQIGADLRRADT